MTAFAVLTDAAVHSLIALASIITSACPHDRDELVVVIPLSNLPIQSPQMYGLYANYIYGHRTVCIIRTIATEVGNSFRIDLMTIRREIERISSSQ